MRDLLWLTGAGFVVLFLVGVAWRIVLAVTGQ